MDRVILKSNASKIAGKHIEKHPNKLIISEKRRMERVEEATWQFFFNDTLKFGYEERVGQQDMALDIVDVLRDGEHIIVEAGVGIGK